MNVKEILENNCFTKSECGLIWSDMEGGYDHDGLPRVYINVLFHHNNSIREVEIGNHRTFFKSQDIATIERLQEVIDACRVNKKLVY